MRHRRLALLALLAGGCSASADSFPGPFPGQDMAGPASDLGGTTAFFEATPLGTSSSPRWVALGDVDQAADRLPDIVIADSADNTVRVLRNRMAGQFPPADRTVHPVEKGPAAVAIGDLDGDGRPDLAVSCSGEGRVSVLRNQGGGVFPTQLAMVTSYPVAAAPGALLLLDLDGAGTLDVALVHGEGDAVSVLLGAGGVLQAPRSYAGGRFLYGLAPRPRAGQPPDLLVASAGTDVVAVLRNSGDGAFALDPAAELRAGAVPVAIYGGDLSGDGVPDFAVANYGSDTVSVLLAVGAAYARTDYAVGRHPVALAAGDLGGQGRMDLLIANQDSGDLTLLVNEGRGAFHSVRVVTSVGSRPVSLAVGDLDGMRGAEAVVVSQKDGAITLLRMR